METLSQAKCPRSRRYTDDRVAHRTISLNAFGTQSPVDRDHEIGDRYIVGRRFPFGVLLVRGWLRSQFVEGESASKRDIKKRDALVGSVHRSEYIEVRRDVDWCIRYLSESKWLTTLVSLDVRDEFPEDPGDV